MANQSKYEQAFNGFYQRHSNEINPLGKKILGKGAFGEVRDVKYKGKAMAVKIMEKSEDDKLQGEKLAINLRNHNIIKIQKIYENEKFKESSSDSKEKNKERNSRTTEKTYDFIIMEKAVLRDLGKLNEFYYRHNLLKLIKLKIDDSYIFDEDMGDNLIRFYARQVINALGAINQNNYIHFDIKPENLLVSVNLIIRLTDFSLLKEIQEKDEKSIKLPGGTQGYTTPEYYIDKNMKIDSARKQDYFALGSSLFILKYGLPLLKYKKYDDSRMNADRIIDLLQQNINFLKSQTFTDKDFMAFIIRLIGYNQDERANFHKIYRNKWLNKNNDILDRILMAFENDEEKLIIELQKKDYLMKKEEKIYKNENNTFGIKYKTNKFRFKKKK